MDVPTLAAGSMCGARRIVQVFPQGVRLLGGCTPLPPGSVPPHLPQQLGKLAVAVLHRSLAVHASTPRCCAFQSHRAWFLAALRHACRCPFRADGEESLQDIWAAELAGAAAAGGGGGGTATIVAADICDPYVVLLLSDGSAALLATDSEGRRLAPLAAEDAEAAVAALQPATEADSLTACSLYRDACAWLRECDFGAAADSGSGDVSGSTYCLLCRASGAVELFALPGWRSVFSCASLAEGPPLLASSGSAAAAAALDPGEEPAPPVLEARLVSFGAVGAGRTDAAAARASRAAACEAPLLLALTADHQLLTYKAFCCPHVAASSSGGVQLRFKRLRLDVPPLLPPAAGASSAGAAQPWRLQRLHCFEGMGEELPFSGVFVTGEAELGLGRQRLSASMSGACVPVNSPMAAARPGVRLSLLPSILLPPFPHPRAGQHPHWVIAARGALLAHPHHLPPPAGPGQPPIGAAGFTPFHNVNCPWGFILATSERPTAHLFSQDALHCHSAPAGCAAAELRSPLWPARNRCCLQAAAAAASRFPSCRLRPGWTRPGLARCSPTPTLPEHSHSHPSAGRLAGASKIQGWVPVDAADACRYRTWGWYPTGSPTRTTCHPPPARPPQRVAVKGTPLKVAHYAEADLLAVLTARQVRVAVGSTAARRQ